VPRARATDVDTPATAGEELLNAAPEEHSDYVQQNRAAWDRWARDHAVGARRAWLDKELRWGLWDTPESELKLVEGLPSGADVIELGSGAAAISSWLARSGLRPIALDFSRVQLDTAERLQRETGVYFPLVFADAEQVPYDTESFDLALSEYGASHWCDPRNWLPEANRLLRPGGQLVFVASSPLLMACTPPSGGRAGDRLVRDLFGDHRVRFPGDDAVEFHLTHGQWLRILRATGFEVLDLREIRPPRGATPRLDFATVEWARRWPSEDVWIARKTGSLP
jgi:SAM-dependent methyltransferase